jgi:hypothetical protein
MSKQLAYCAGSYSSTGAKQIAVQSSGVFNPFASLWLLISEAKIITERNLIPSSEMHKQTHKVVRGNSTAKA